MKTILLFLCFVWCNLINAQTTMNWVSKANMPEARNTAASVSYGNYIFVIGGNYRLSLYRYDAINNSWTTLTVPMPTPRSCAATVVYNNEIYVIGGLGNGSLLNVVEGYNPSTNSWSTKAPMPSDRHIAVAEIVNNKIYVCGGANSSGSLSTTEELTIIPCSPPAVPGAINGYNSLCLDNQSYSYSINAVPNAQSYNWSASNGQVSGQGTSINITWLSAGTNTISVTAQNTCGTSAAQTMNVTVYPLPTLPTISQAGNVLTCSFSSSYQSYQWYYNNNPIINANSQTYTATQDGNYYVVVIDNNGCTNQSTSLSVTGTGFSNINLVNYFDVFPNPAIDGFKINIFSKKFSLWQIKLFTLFGSLIYSETLENISGEYSKEIKVDKVQPGIYYLQIKSDNETFVRKLVIEK